MKLIKLNLGYVAVVDDCDFDLVSAFTWHANKRGGTVYVEASIMRDGVKTRLKMHRLIMGATKGIEVDHINGIGLDNQRSNLRVATRSQNSANRGNNRKAGFRGVYRTSGGKFEVRLTVRPKVHYLGRFISADEAARAYDAAALAAFGEFARLNFPTGVSA